MKLRFYIKIFLYAVMDCFFHWLSWIGAVFVFAYLFVSETPSAFRQLDIQVINQHIVYIVIANVLFFTICGVYKSLWQHSGIGTLIRITTAVLLSTFSVYVAIRLHLGFWINPGIGVMAFYFFLTLSLAPRVYKRVLEILISYLRNYVRLLPRHSEPDAVRTLLIGAGESASGLMLHTSQQGARPRKILGVLDNDPRKQGYALHGVTILGGDEKIPQLVKDLNIDEIIIAVPSMNNEDLRRIVRLTPVNRCKVRLLSGLSVDKASDMLREVNITDLLGRHEAELNAAGLNAWISKKVVMVTGGGGSIGSELCRQLLQLDVEKIVIYEISENNAHNLKEELKVKFGQTGRYKVAVRIGSIQDEARLEQVFNEFKPSVVFHAAAYKHVPLMEECPRLAIDNNVLGTYRTAKVAIRHGVERFVMISTDKAVNPTNVMGASKRLAELATLGLNAQKVTEFVCVRFGNVLESNGSVIPTFKRQIEAGGPVTVTHSDIIRYFMTMPEAARLVLEAGAMAGGGEIFVLDMGDPVKIMDLAENLIRMAGLTPGVDIDIEIIGLRPGEKLYEELLLDEEGLSKTLNDKIFVIKPAPPLNFNDLIQAIEVGTEDVHDLLKRFAFVQGDQSTDK